MKLVKPIMISQQEQKDTFGRSQMVETQEPFAYISHCDNIAHILAHTVFMWNARRKIRRYLAITGAIVK